MNQLFTKFNKYVQIISSKGDCVMSNLYMLIFNIYYLIVAVINIGFTMALIISLIRYRFEDTAKPIGIIFFSILVGTIFIALTLYISAVFGIKLDSGIQAILALPIAFAIVSGVLLHQEKHDQ